MIIEYHMILVENLVKSSAESFNKSLVIFYFDFAAEDYLDNADQNSCNIVKFSFFLF